MSIHVGPCTASKVKRKMDAEANLLDVGARLVDALALSVCGLTLSRPMSDVLLTRFNTVLSRAILVFNVYIKSCVNKMEVEELFMFFLSAGARLLIIYEYVQISTNISAAIGVWGRESVRLSHTFILSSLTKRSTAAHRIASVHLYRHVAACRRHFIPQEFHLSNNPCYSLVPNKGAQWVHSKKKQHPNGIFFVRSG